MNSTVDEIKKKIDIVEFIGNFVALKKAGRNFKGICPFHQEKTPSFVVSPDRQIWHCFGSCGDGGDAIKFLMKWENITFFEALKELAEKTGVKLKDVSFEDKMWEKKERLLRANQLAAEYFAYVLAKTDFGKKGLEYLKSRDINIKTIEVFQLGYSPQSWDSLFNFLKKKKFMESELLEAGLLVKNERGSVYDRFRGRLMFPIKDPRGNVIGFSGRSLDDKEKAAKYINSPESPIYHKRESLFGIQTARDAIKKEGNVFIVEGEFDVISPYQHGFENFVAIKGSALTREQLMLLKRYTSRATLALDADSSGEDAAKRGIEEAEKFDMELDILQFNFAKDPDEAVRADLPKFKKELKRHVPIYDFIIEFEQKKYPEEDAFSKKKIGDAVVPFIERITNPIIQSHYIKKLSDILEVSEGSVNELIRKYRQRRKQQSFIKSSYEKKESTDREKNLQTYLLSTVFQNEYPYDMIDAVFKVLAPSDFSYPAYEKLCDELLAYQKKNPKLFKLQDFLKGLSSELRAVFDELYLYSTYKGEEEENIDKLILEIKKLTLKRKISDLAKKDGDLTKEEEKKVSDLSSALKDVEKKLLPV